MLIYVFGVFVGDFFWGRPLLLLAGSINLDIFGPISSVINKKYAFLLNAYLWTSLMITYSVAITIKVFIFKEEFLVILQTTPKKCSSHLASYWGTEVHIESKFYTDNVLMYGSVSALLWMPFKEWLEMDLLLHIMVLLQLPLVLYYSYIYDWTLVIMGVKIKILWF